MVEFLAHNKMVTSSNLVETTENNNMGFFINEEIITKLHYKDIALIAATFGDYQERYANTADKDVLERMEKLVNRLGSEMVNNPENDKPDSH